MRAPVTLQISLAPSDHRLAEHLLPHQLRIWREQVDEILLTVDLHRSRGRFSDEWEQGRERILTLARSQPGAQVLEVDYSPDARQSVAAEFFGNCPIPVKDHRGGPYYAYFFGLYAARHSVVLHLDADMFFGGGSTTWLGEAVALLQKDPDILVTAPLPGPPSPDGNLVELPGRRLTIANLAYEFPEMSTRLFLLDRRRFRERLKGLTPRRANLRGCLLAWLEGNPPFALPEQLLSVAMRQQGLRRVDFLGSAPGLWSLHPPYRGEDFYTKLPALITKIETGDLPRSQLGFHDIADELVDWSEGRRRLQERRWWRRLREKR